MRHKQSSGYMKLWFLLWTLKTSKHLELRRNFLKNAADICLIIAYCIEISEESYILANKYILYVCVCAYVFICWVMKQCEKEISFENQKDKRHVVGHEGQYEERPKKGWEKGEYHQLHPVSWKTGRYAQPRIQIDHQQCLILLHGLLLFSKNM